jgi:Rad3-related DNA helicase
MENPKILSDEQIMKVNDSDIEVWVCDYADRDRAIAQAQLDDTWQKAQEYYEPLLLSAIEDLRELEETFHNRIQQAKAEVVERFQKAVKDLKEGKDIDLAEREFEVFFSIRNDGLAEGYGKGKAEVVREMIEEIEKHLLVEKTTYIKDGWGNIGIRETTLWLCEWWQSLKSKYTGGQKK